MGANTGSNGPWITGKDDFEWEMIDGGMSSSHRITEGSTRQESYGRPLDHIDVKTNAELKEDKTITNLEDSILGIVSNMKDGDVDQGVTILKLLTVYKNYCYQYLGVNHPKAKSFQRFIALNKKEIEQALLLSISDATIPDSASDIIEEFLNSENEYKYFDLGYHFIAGITDSTITKVREIVESAIEFNGRLTSPVEFPDRSNIHNIEFPMDDKIIKLSAHQNNVTFNKKDKEAKTA